MVEAGQAARAGARPWVTAFESRGLKPGQARAKPFRWLWLGPRVEKAKAPSGQAKAGETLTPRYTRKAQADRAPGFADKALSERWRSADKAQ